MRATAWLLAGALFVMPLLPGAARSQGPNQMGYRLVTQEQASALPRNGGALGLDIRRGQVITDAAMTFEILSVSAVRAGSAGAQAGFKSGDQIIAVNGMVFASLAAFAAYVGSLPPGQTASVDYMPSGGGPQQAQRVGVTVGAAGGAAASAPPAPAAGAAASAPTPEAGGLSTGAKLAIGAAAVALFQCYKANCFSRMNAKPAAMDQRTNVH